jgi:hypothetical protein
MSKNTDRIKKLKAYSACAAAILVGQQTANASIKYTDVDPDYDITKGNTFELDINNDNKVDFIFAFNTSSWWGNQQALVATDNPNNKVKALCQSSSWYSYNWFWCNGVDALEKGDSIGLSIDWTMDMASYWNNMNYDFFAGIASYMSNTGYYYYYYGNQSPWLGAQSKYLGVRFQIGSNVHYGWLRLDVDDKASKITLKDYAYNTVPFEGLTAGEKSNSSTSDINEDLWSEMVVYSFENKIKISGDARALSSAMVSVHNLMGQIVYKGQIQSAATAIEINETFGNYYVVSIQKEDEIITKKLFLKQ